MAERSLSSWKVYFPISGHLWALERPSSAGPLNLRAVLATLVRN